MRAEAPKGNAPALRNSTEIRSAPGPAGAPSPAPPTGISWEPSRRWPWSRGIGFEAARDRDKLAILLRKLHCSAMRVEIAHAGAADRDALCALLAAQFEEHDILVSPEELADAVDGVFDEPTRGIFWVARAGGRPVGVAYLAFTWALEHGGRSAWLEQLYVLPELRGQGIGRSLLLDACEYAEEKAGCAAVELEVEESHARSSTLYAREGFLRRDRTRWVRRLR